jgi:hypothetical protein
MPKMIPKKTFLLRQEQVEGKKPKDVIAHKGVAIDVSNAEAVQFAGYWDVSDDKEKKKVTDAAKVAKEAKRIV